MSSVVIAGGTGFIGRHLSKYFLENGFDIYILSHSHRFALEDSCTSKLHILTCDYSDLSTAAEQLPKSPEAFFCLSWNGVSPEQRNDYDLQVSNISLVLNAVRLAALIKAQKFILPGSTSEYAYSGELITRYTAPTPQNAYGAAKVAARFLCQSLCKELLVPYIYVVITGIYAADRTDNNVIFYTISQLLNKARPHLTKLEQKWDYVHIDDVVRALYLVSMKGKNGAFYGIGHGDNWPLAQYIHMIHQIIAPDLPLGVGDVPYRDKVLPSSCVDLSSLYEDTGFVPQVSFEQGIIEVIQQMEEKSKENQTGGFS